MSEEATDEWRNLYEGAPPVPHPTRQSADRYQFGRTGLQRRTVTTSEWEEVPLIDPKPGDCVKSVFEVGEDDCSMIVSPAIGGRFTVLAWVDGRQWYGTRGQVDAGDIVAIVPHPQTGELR